MIKRDQKITSKIMSAIKSKDTKPEMIIRKLLWKKGYRYRIHYKIKGKPDIVFVGKKLAVFIDGDFWHGNNWQLRGLSSLEKELESYSNFWKEKILRNMNRDKQVNEQLKKEGWTVLRYWESDIKKNSPAILQDIIEKLSIQEQ